jgi:hypothetical protein
MKSFGTKNPKQDEMIQVSAKTLQELRGLSESFEAMVGILYEAGADMYSQAALMFEPAVNRFRKIAEENDFPG